MDFEWDQRKAASNFEKHGVTFDEAATAFSDPLSLTIADPDHSEGEFRYMLLGLSDEGRLIVVSHTERDARIRIIGARPAAPREIRDYEQGT
jgi:uncharacterized protein